MWSLRLIRSAVGGSTLCIWGVDRQYNGKRSFASHHPPFTRAHLSDCTYAARAPIATSCSFHHQPVFIAGCVLASLPRGLCVLSSIPSQ